MWEIIRKMIQWFTLRHLFIPGNSNPNDEKEQLESAIAEITLLKKKVTDANIHADQFKVKRII